MNFFHLAAWPITYSEALLDRTTMYRVVIYALLTLVIYGFGLGILSIIPQTFMQQLAALVVALVVALVTNALLARLWRVSANYESAVITALIIYFLMSPPQAILDLHYIALATALAMLSKYVIAINKQHLINPAAAGVAALSVVGYYEATWWVGTPEFFIPLVLVGLAVVYKLRRFQLVFTFLLVGFAVFVFEEWRLGFDPLQSWSIYWLSWPALFLGFFMLTEPFTMPPTKRLLIGYGALVGVLSSAAWFQPWIVMSPELALIIGNLVFYPASLRRKLILPLVAKRHIARDTYEYEFAPVEPVPFKAGQYMEWMLPHGAQDARGVRRYFTIASSPTESTIKVALKHMSHGSSYKRALEQLEPGGTIIASQRAGDFVLPADPQQKVAAIAGGIGVTPFRSHIQYLVDTQRHTDYVLYYCNNELADAAYADVFASAATQIPLKVIGVLANEVVPSYEHGFVTAEMIARNTPDYLERAWYLSGPPGMVKAYDTMLQSMGVSPRNIIKDFFPGLA